MALHDGQAYEKQAKTQKMADLRNPSQPHGKTLGTEVVLLSVLCFLNVGEIQNSLVTEDGLRSIALEGFPKTVGEFIQAQSSLREARMKIS